MAFQQPVIKVEYGGGDNLSDFTGSHFSKASSSRIQYGGNTRVNYKQRDGDRAQGSSAMDILTADYPQFVDESKTLDGNLNSFEAFQQIYGAFNRHSNSDVMKIKRRFGHSEFRTFDHQKRLLNTFTSQGSTSPSKKTSSKVVQLLVKKYAPQGAHLGGLMGGQSEETAVKAAQKRLQSKVQTKIEVNSPAVNKFIRGISLNEKFQDTWVAEGLHDYMTKSALAKKTKQPDMVQEIIEADIKADEWIEKQKEVENYAWVFKDPPVSLSRYYTNFCNQNATAYNEYKTLGISEMARQEVERHKYKQKLQEEAEEKGIKPSKMLKFQKRRAKEEIWSQFIPEKLLLELQRKDKKLATTAADNDDLTSVNTANMPQVKPLSSEIDSIYRMQEAMDTIIDEPSRKHSQNLEVDEVDNDRDSLQTAIYEGRGTDSSIEPDDLIKTHEYGDQKIGDSRLSGQMPYTQFKSKQAVKESRNNNNSSVMMTYQHSPPQKRSSRQSINVAPKRGAQNLSNGFQMLNNKMAQTQAAFNNISQTTATQSKVSPKNFNYGRVSPQIMSNFHMQEIKQAPRVQQRNQSFQKRASAQDVAQLTERLSVPKNYSRTKYAERYERLQSIDWTVNEPLQYKKKGVNQPLPKIKLSQRNVHQTNSTMQGQKGEFQRLMSLNFGNNYSRRRQFVNRTTIDNYDDSKTTKKSPRTSTSNFGTSHMQFQQTTRHADFQQRFQNDQQSNLMNSTMRSTLGRNDLDQMLNATSNSRAFGGLKDMMISTTEKLGQGRKSPNPRQDTRLAVFRQRSKIIEELASSLSKRKVMSKSALQSKKTSPKASRPKQQHVQNVQAFQTINHSSSPPIKYKNSKGDPMMSTIPHPQTTERISPNHYSKKHEPLQVPFRKTMLNQRSGSILDLHALNMSQPVYVSQTLNSSPRQSQMISPSHLNTKTIIQGQMNQQKIKQKGKLLPHRVSNFELNMGMHKQRSSQLKLEHEFKIHRMMSKPGVSPRQQNKDNSNDTSTTQFKSPIKGTNLQAYDWERHQENSATFEHHVINANLEFATTNNNSMIMSQSEVDSDDEINKIPFSKKSTKVAENMNKTVDQKINVDVIHKCMRYMNKMKRDDVIRDHDIEIAIEDYLTDRRKYVFKILDEIETYPAGLQKTLFNYKLNYDDEQEMFSREIIHMYKSGETDPRYMLNKLAREAAENPDDSDEEVKAANIKKQSLVPKLSCFKKKKESIDASN